METPPGDDPPWLVRLREAIFTVLPAEEPEYEWRGLVYHCGRRLTERRGQLRFEEELRDPITFGTKYLWGMDLEAGAFVGTVPDEVFAQMVAVVLHGIAAQRPLGHAPQAPSPEWNPMRYAHRPRQRPATL